MAGRLNSTEEAILNLCRQHASAGLSNDVLEQELAHIPVAARAAALNSLLTRHRLEILQHPTNGSLVYKEVVAEDAVRFKGLGAEELLVYQQIKLTGNQGIWTKDLKMKTNLAQPVITKLLKTLEGRSLIKAIKSVAHSARKVYMLYELEPARELTGGAWYTEHQYDKTFIDTMQQVCHQYIKAHGEVSAEDVAKYIKGTRLAREELRLEDVMSLINCLVYDGVVDNVEHEDGDRFRPAMLEVSSKSAITSVPCGVCPVIQECTPDGRISPSTCVYYQKWLDF